jgi:hypothetical protein
MAAAAEIENLLYQAIGERMTADEAVEALDRCALTLAAALTLAEALGGGPSAPGLWWTEAEPGRRRAAALPPSDLLGAARQEALHAG